MPAGTSSSFNPKAGELIYYYTFTERFPYGLCGVVKSQSAGSDGLIVVKFEEIGGSELFDDYNYISKYGENLYDLVDGGQITASDAKVQQGCIEGSNVNVVDEMVKMITISRAYQAGQKVINTVDETLDKTVNQVGKV